jgi:hypothetical protein
MRTPQAEIVENEGKWDLKREEHVIANESPRDYSIRLRRQNYPQWTRFEAPVYQIFPSSVRVVPLWLLAIVLGVFLILIGPADWFLLGAIRRHRLTWMLFPLVAVSVTAGTVILVRRFMGTSNHESAIIISDIGVAGRVVRETRIELELPATGKVASTSVRNSLRMPATTFSRYGQRIESTWSNVEYQGQYPARFNYTRSQRQWSPEISRVTAIVDAPDTSGIKWDAFDAEFLERNKIVFQETPMDKQPSKELRSFYQAVYQAAVATESREVWFSFFTKWGTRDSELSSVDANWRNAITLAEPFGSTALLTHVSPNGYPQFGDLRILDREDPSRTVVLIAVREGKNIHVWRRLYLH